MTETKSTETDLVEFTKGIKFSQLHDKNDCERIRNEFYERFDERLKTLSQKEVELFMQMRGKSGVLFIQGKPGIAKSAKMRSIAKKMGMLYVDFRLSMVDETDVGMYPKVISRDVDGIETSFLDHVAPLWAFEANRVPTLIHFEEINRASQHVRNASMQILLERAVGIHFLFNNDVYMVCSGNLGDEDNTDVEELDSALNGRLIHKKFSLEFDEWINDFAKVNVHPTIVKYLSFSPEQFYPTNKNKDENAYACPRTWTFLSDFFKENFSNVDNKGNFISFGDPSKFLDMSNRVAHEYIGTGAAMKFNKYLKDSLTIKVDDILNKYQKVQNEVLNADQSRWAEWFHTLKEAYKITDMLPKQVDNLVLFLKDASGEQLIAFLTYTLDKTNSLKHENMIKVMKAFKEEYNKINGINTEMRNDKMSSNS